jgi:hypothetical protein
MLSYGALVWAHRNIPDYLVSRLTTLNRLAATGLGPMRRNTPTAGLEVILDLQPLDLVVSNARNNHATLHATEQSRNLATQQSCNLQRNNHATLQHNNKATL